VKILLVNDYGVQAGGAERVSVILRDGLRDRGHDARLLTSTARPTPGNNPADYTCFGSESGLRRVLQVANPWAVLALRRALDRFRPDVVHVRMFFTQLSPLIMPLLREVPSVLHLVNYQTVCPLNTKVLPDGTRCRLPAGRACHQAGCVSLLGLARTVAQLGWWRRWRSVFDRLIANSAGLARRLEEAGVPVDGVISNGTPVRPARPALGDHPVVAYAGRLASKKGVDVLLRAMPLIVARHPDCRLLIAGDGPDRRALARLVLDLGLERQVTMLGHLSAGELEQALASAWVLAVPSVYDEPFANTAVESLMRGTAVVASAVGGSEEIVDHGLTGLLVPRGDVTALAGAIERLVSNRSLAEEMGAAGRVVALERFTEGRMVDRFVDLYRSM
jgi:glycosyltransferase involved in cell wall biosynthesis